MNLYQNISDLKNEWEQWTNKKIVLNRVRREVGHRLKDYEFTVEERRERYDCSVSLVALIFQCKLMLTLSLRFKHF